MSASKKNLSWLGLLGFAVLSAAIAVVSVGAKRRNSSIAKSGDLTVALTTAQVTDSVVPQRKKPIADFESEIVTVHPYGFEPAEIKRPKGRFLLIVNDRSGLTASSLRLNPVTGAALRAVNMRREEPDWSDLVDLGPGVYLLTETSHPLWVCRITIMPR